MNRNADNWKQWKEKTLLLLKKGKEWVLRNKKTAIPATAVILVLLLVCVSFLPKNGKKQEESSETLQTGTELSTIPVPEVPLEENAVAPVNMLMEKYYKALADDDIDTIAELKNYVSDLEKLKIEKKSHYIEIYENIVCYTKAGLAEGTYLVYVYNEAKMKGFETPVPALNTFVVMKNDSGEYYIYEGDLDDNTFNYFQELSAQEDVANLCNTVQAKYNEVIAEDEQLAEFMEQFPELVKSEVSKALAELEQENAQPEESEAEAEEVEEEETTQPQAQVTEVVTTDTVNVRSSDSETADKIGKVDKGTTLPLIEKRENGWSKITYEGKEGYIKSMYLSDVVTLVNADTAQEETSAQQTEETPQKPEGGNSFVGTDGKVTAKTTVNVRASANENGEKLGVIYQGEKLELVMQQADGWCKVKYKGKTGYVKTEFVE